MVYPEKIVAAHVQQTDDVYHGQDTTSVHLLTGTNHDFERFRRYCREGLRDAGPHQTHLFEQSSILNPHALNGIYCGIARS